MNVKPEIKVILQKQQKRCDEFLEKKKMR